MPDCFYEPDGDRYMATELTRGPWDSEAQHAGPPAALIAREVERLGGGRIGGEDGFPAHVGRITYELLRPVPIGPLRVEAEIVRPGRRVEMFEATLSDDRGEPLMRAQGWRLRTDEVFFEMPPEFPHVPGTPQEAEPGSFFDTGYDVGYHSAMEYRFTRGSLHSSRARRRSGCGWRCPLLPAQEPSPLQRVLVAADSGNGVSAALDWRQLPVHQRGPVASTCTGCPRASGSAWTR